MIDYGLSVSLDTLDEADIEQLRTWRNSYDIWRYCRQNDLISQANHKTWFDWQSEDPNTRMYMICDGKKIDLGVIGFTEIDWINRRAEFSLYIGSDYRGKGYAKDALMTLTSHGFTSLGLNSIYGEVFEHNHAWNMFADVGFIHEGIRREFYFREGKFINAVVISMLKSEWDKNELFDECRTPCFT